MVKIRAPTICLLTELFIYTYLNSHFVKVFIIFIIKDILVILDQLVIYYFYNSS